MSGWQGSKPKRCLIVKLGAIGDVVQLLPAAHALMLTGTEIDWVCGQSVLPLLECYSWIRPIPVDEKRLLRGGMVAAALEIAKLWRRLSIPRYELCATMYFDRRYRLLTALVRAGRKIALSQTERNGMLVAGRNRTDEFARILFGDADSCKRESLAPISPDRLPQKKSSTQSAPRIALVPGGAKNLLRDDHLRRWPLESYREIAATYCARGWQVVLTGGPEDAWTVSAFDGLPVDNLVGRTSIPELLNVYAGCDLLISHDTGPLHLAGMTDCLLVGIFGPTNPWMFMPRRKGALALWGGEGFACRPCYDGGEYAPCTSNECMRTVTPQDVVAAVDRLLDERAGDARLLMRVELHS